MADFATLAPTATGGQLGHFLPYLLRRRLRDVVWPADGGERAVSLLLLGLGLAYGAGLGTLLNHAGSADEPAAFSPGMLVGLNVAWLASALLVDFLPTLRPVTRVLPEHFPVSPRWNAAAAFLLNLITLRRLLIIITLLMAMAVAPANAVVPGFSLLLMLGATVFSFNLRLLATLRRWQHPLMLAHLASLGLMLWWLAHPEAPYNKPLGVGMAVLPWLLGAAQLYWLGPYFSARYLPDAAPTAAPTATGQLLDRLSPEWKVYVRKAWLPLLIGLVFKIVIVVGAGLLARQGDSQRTGFFAAFFFAFLPAVGFTYVNNNLFGFLRTIVANEVQRTGLTRRVLALYLRLTGPVVVVDSLLSAGLLLAFFPAEKWWMLGLLPLGTVAMLSVGLWGSLYQSKPVTRAVDFANMRNNVSTMMSLCTMAIAVALYFLPWWWARIALALVVTASAYWPIQAVLRNDGPLRRKLWRGIGA
ncbi:hypothetical protein [Hymenobacter sp. UYCo722]|uniref:hypothetical protein n=1 Tax=Hymenobacter sp. UYCo722 TaxID=3156335 RepID=UPI0033963D3E